MDRSVGSGPAEGSGSAEGARPAAARGSSAAAHGSSAHGSRRTSSKPKPGPAKFPVDVWQLRETSFDRGTLARNEALFTLGNGNIGFRGNFEEAGYNSANGTYINGFFEAEPIVYPEPAFGYARTRQVMLNVADTKPIRLFVGEDYFDLRAGHVESYERGLDLRTGVLTRRVRWRSPAGVLAEIDVRRIVSLARREIAAIQYSVTLPETDGTIRFESLIDGTVSNQQTGDDPRVGTRLRSPLQARLQRASGSSGVLVQRARNSGNEVAAAADHEWTAGEMRAGVEPDPKTGCTRIRFTLAAPAQAHQPVMLTKYIAYRTSLELPGAELADVSQQDVEAARETGFEALLAEHKAVLDRFWEISDVKLEGDDELQQGIRFNLFSLLAAAGRDGRTSIAAKGLSGEGYEGHYFWDAETYALPFFIYTHPDIARQLLTFRCRTLDHARERARELGHRGALFPWRTIAGEETSPYFEAGTAQYHIDADIAFALGKYVSATGDTSLLLEGGAELLFETARFWLSLGSYVDEQGGDFCINEVTGPDEYTALVNNNYFTNLMAQWNLRYAVTIANYLQSTHPGGFELIARTISLEPAEIDDWARAADRMRLPFHRGLGIHAQDDVFLTRAVWDFAGTPPEKYPLLLHFHPLNVYRYQVLKQPDVVLAQVLLPERFTTAEKRRNFDYYDPITTGDSSLAPCIQSVAAAELGYTERAFNYFRQTARMDLDDVGGNTAAGVHIAAMAGTWVSLVYGFAGMRDRRPVLSFDPRLPAGLTAMRIRLRFRSRLIEVAIDHDDATYELLEGDAISVQHRGREMGLKRGESVSVSLRPELAGVVFDLDGVLTNTAEFHYLAWKRLADEMGWPFDRRVNEWLKGVGRLGSLDIILSNAGVSLPPEERVRLATRKNEYFGELIRTIEPGDLLPGMSDLLVALRVAGVKIAVASVSHNIWEVVRRLSIEEQIDAIVDPATLVKGKPDPEVFFTAADMLGLPYENCAGIEDAQVGVEAIKAARMFTVGVGADLTGADWRVDGTAEITYDGLLAHFQACNAKQATEAAKATEA